MSLLILCALLPLNLFQKLSTTENLQQQVLPFAVPVLSPISGARIGVLLAAYDWGQVGSVVSSALQRSRDRGQQSFALEVLAEDGTPLYESHADGASRPAEPVRVEALNSDAVRDVGDGWRFVATVDPEEAYAPLARASTVALLLTAASMLLAGLGAWLLAHGMTRPISKLSEVVGRIVREGDLTQQVQVSSRRDEVSELAGAFSRMMSHLRESTASLQQGTRVLGQTVAELTAAASQQERNLSRQAAALQVRASGDSLRELAGIIQDNANAAQQIAAAVTQQNAGVAQSFTAVTDLSRMMEETLQGLKGTQRTTEMLRDVAQRMEVVASTYRV